MAIPVVAQQVFVETLTLVEAEETEFRTYPRIDMPVVRTGDTRIDSSINADIRQRLFGNQDEMQEALEMLSYLGYQVTFNRGGILSITVNSEGCGAYCSNWSTYLTYDTTTGTALLLPDIVHISDAFKSIVSYGFSHQLNEQKEELAFMLDDPDFEMDEQTYLWALERYNQCILQLNEEEYVLYPDHIRIIANCSMPHAIRNLTPVFNLSYSYSEISDHLLIAIPVE